MDKECRSGCDAVAVNGDPRKDYACAGGSAFCDRTCLTPVLAEPMLSKSLSILLF